MSNKTENNMDEPMQTAPSIRKKTLWLWVVLCLVSGILTMVQIYMNSPVHEAIRYFDEGSFYRFERIYVYNVRDNELHRQIFNWKMRNRLNEEFDHCYEILRTGGEETDIEESLRGYIARTGKLLRTCKEPVLTEDVRQKFDVLAEEVYADYLESEQAYNRARNIMGRIVGTGYCSDKTKADYHFLLKVGEMEQELSAGKHYESKGQYYYAITAYRQAVEHPKRGAEAQAAADRCLAVFRADALSDLRSKAATDARKAWTQLKLALSLSPDDAELQQLCDQFDRYVNNSLHAYIDNRAENPLFTNLLREGTDGHEIVTDGSGKAHDIFNLYKLEHTHLQYVNNYPCAFVRLTAKQQGDTGLTRLTFTVDPSALCGDGKAKIQVLTKAHGNDTSIRPRYTSPMLTKDSPTLTVDVNMDYDAVGYIALSSYGGTVEFLIDNVYVESYRPGKNK